MSLFLFPPAPAPADAVFRLRVDCDPRGKARPKAARSGPKCSKCGNRSGTIIMRTHAADDALEAELAAAAREVLFRQQLKRLDGPLLCLVVGLWPRLKVMPDRNYSGRQWKTSTPDFDNLAKLATDALNDIVFVDDRQIVHGQAITMFAAEHEKPGIEIYLWQAPPFPPEQ